VQLCPWNTFTAAGRARPATIAVGTGDEAPREKIAASRRQISTNDVPVLLQELKHLASVLNNALGRNHSIPMAKISHSGHQESLRTDLPLRIEHRIGKRDLNLLVHLRSS
jgi:hypothetical protein